MPVFLPIAGLSIDGLWLVGAGTFVGFLSGLLGVGGGFLLTPILIMIGVPPTIAAASDTNAIVATSSSGVAAHFRLGNVDIKMGSILLLGGLTGAAIGVEAIKVLRVLGNADVFIKLTYVFVLGSVGVFMLLESIHTLRREGVMVQPAKVRPRMHLLDRLPFQMDFPRSHVRHSVLVPFLLCVLVGILAAVMGVGGGFLMVPMMVYLLRMPAHVAVGTDLFQILFTCAGVTLMQATTNHTVDIVLALLLALGSTIGAQLGAAVSRLLRGQHLMILLSTLALAVVIKIAFGLAATPSNMLEIGHDGGPAPHAAAGLAEPAAAPGQVAAPGSSVNVTPQAIQIGATYSGTDMHIKGFAPAGSRMVVVARGPDSAETFNRKGRVGPIWVTAGHVTVSGVPSIFIRYSPEPVERFLPRSEIERYQLDPLAIRRQMRISPPEAELGRVREDYVRLKTEQRVYRVIDGSVRMGETGPAGTAFEVRFHWPRKAPPATYEVRVHECRNGAVVGTATVPLEVAKTGLPAALARIASDASVWYGIAAVVIAMLTGFGLDFVVAGARRKLMRRPARPAAAGAGTPAGQNMRDTIHH